MTALVEELRATMSRGRRRHSRRAGLAARHRTILLLKSEAADEARDMLTTSLCIACAAYTRRESRGAHFRSDYPNRRSARAGEALASRAPTRSSVSPRSSHADHDADACASCRPPR